MKQIAALLLAFLVGGITVQWLLHKQNPAALGWRTEPPARPHADVSSGRAAAPVIPGVGATPLAADMTLSEIANLRGDFEQTAALYQLLRGKNAAAIIALLSDAKAAFTGSDYNAASGILYSRLGELDPERALSLALAGSGLTLNYRLHAIFHAWARVDFDAALQRAESLTPTQQKVAGQALLLSRADLSAKVRDETLAKLGLDARPIATEEDIPVAWAEALRAGVTPAKLRKLTTLAARWGALSPTAAMQAVDTSGLPPNYRTALEQRVLQQWLEKEPVGATQWLLDQPNAKHHLGMLRRAFAAFAEADPIAAQSRALELEGKNRTQALLGLLTPVAIKDPSTAAALLNEYLNGDNRRNAVRAVTVQLIQQSVQQAESWAALLDPADRATAESALTMSLINSDPATAAARITDSGDSAKHTYIGQRLMRSWGRQDPQSAATWVTNQPTETRNHLYTSLAQTWAQWDPQATLALARKLPNPAHQDHVRLGVLRTLNDTDEMRELYANMSDERARKMAAQQIYRRLKRSQPDVAEEFAADNTGVKGRPG